MVAGNQCSVKVSDEKGKWGKDDGYQFGGMGHIMDDLG